MKKKREAKKKVMWSKIICIVSCLTICLSICTIFVSADSGTTGDVFRTEIYAKGLYSPDAIMFYSGREITDGGTYSLSRSFTFGNNTYYSLSNDINLSAEDIASKYDNKWISSWGTNILNVNNNTIVQNYNTWYLHTRLSTTSTDINDSKIVIRQYLSEYANTEQIASSANFYGRYYWRYTDKILPINYLDSVDYHNGTITSGEYYRYMMSGNTPGIHLICDDRFPNDNYNYEVFAQYDYTIEVINPKSGIKSLRNGSQTIKASKYTETNSGRIHYIVPYMVLTKNDANDAKQSASNVRIVNATCTYYVNGVNTETNEPEYVANLDYYKIYYADRMDYEGDGQRRQFTIIEQENARITGIRSMVDWLQTALGGVMKFEIGPFSVGGLLALIISISVVMAFLRMFHA